MEVECPSLSHAIALRIEKTVNDKKTEYLYDGLDIIAEVEDGIVTAKYLRGLGIDEVFARMDGTGTRYYHKDGLGSTIALTDSSGQVKTRYAYAPFGETTVTGDPDANPFQYNRQGKRRHRALLLPGQDTMIPVRGGSSARIRFGLRAGMLIFMLMS